VNLNIKLIAFISNHNMVYRISRSLDLSVPLVCFYHEASKQATYV
jgi:hypothetical protein